MKRGVVFIIILGLVLSFASGCASDKELQTYKAVVEKLNQQITTKDMYVEEKVKEIEANLLDLNEKYYEEKLTVLLGAERLLYLAKEQWNYSLYVNQKSFKEESMRVAGKEINLVLVEEELQNEALPMAVHKKGSVTSSDQTDKFHEHMTIQANVPYEQYVSKYENQSIAVFTFKNVPKGTVITLTLTEPLRERLKAASNKLEIVVDR